MPIDYSLADRILELSFKKLDRSRRMGFPKPGTLSSYVSQLMSNPTADQVLSHQYCPMLASAGVEMWHRAIHSFLWSVTLTESSPLWSSITGYYASHFVMRAFAHSMGIFKSFTRRTAVQIVTHGAQFVCAPLSDNTGEHAFYWKAVKGHPGFVSNSLFRENNERENNRREDKSDVLHRNFANYTDHVDSFTALAFSSANAVAQRVEKIHVIRRYSVRVLTPQRDGFPDLDTVQILAFQRIVAFHDFLDEKVPDSPFWRAHRRPSWCKDVMLFQIEDRGMEQPLVA